MSAVSATARFYTGFAIVLAAIVGLSYWAGYHAGSARAAHAPSHAVSTSAPGP